MGPMIITDSAYEGLSGEEKIAKLNELIEQWREPNLVHVLPEVVIPDTTNRCHTGLSVNHVHYIADKMQRTKFTPRNLITGDGHDLPIVIRETMDSECGVESLEKWQNLIDKKPELPKTNLGLGQQCPKAPFYCSLGNGHFFQALNLFGTNAACKFPQITGQKRYWVNFDPQLKSAVKDHGVPCVVLRAGMCKRDRKFISEMLNSTFEFQWVLQDLHEQQHYLAPNEVVSSRVKLDVTKGIFREFESFDGLAKHADAFELDEVVESKMKFEERDKKMLEQQKQKRVTRLQSFL